MRTHRLLVCLLGLFAVAAWRGCDTIGCFVAGTQILTPSGAIPIEAIRIGQLVYSYDQEQGRPVLGTVTQVFVHRDVPYETLLLPGGGSLGVTANHPVYAGGRYVEASALGPADQVLSLAIGPQGPRVRPQALAAGTRMAGRATVYNLAVYPQHNYFAGGILVHNKSPGPPYGTNDHIPACVAGQALSTNSNGQIICKSLPAGTLVLTKCDANTEALTANRQGVACTNRNEGAPNDPALVKRINDAEDKLGRSGVMLNELANKPGATRVYVGNTAATSNGNLLNLDITADNALVAAAKVCATQYGAGARMCTVQDIYLSAVKGAIGSAKNITKAWVYAPSWNNPAAGSVNPTLGYGDTCGSYTYPTGDNGWQGIAVSTGANEQTTRWGIRFIGGADTSCAATLPLACCK